MRWMIVKWPFTHTCSCPAVALLRCASLCSFVPMQPCPCLVSLGGGFAANGMQGHLGGSSLRIRYPRERTVVRPRLDVQKSSGSNCGMNRDTFLLFLRSQCPRVDGNVSRPGSQNFRLRRPVKLCPTCPAEGVSQHRADRNFTSLDEQDGEFNIALSTTSSDAPPNSFSVRDLIRIPMAMAMRSVTSVQSML